MEGARQSGFQEHEEPRLCVLGSLRLRAGGSDVAFDRSLRVRRVLAALVIQRAEPVSSERLADIAWGEAQPVDPKAAIYNLISRLRVLLTGIDGVRVVTRPPGYLLHAPRSAVDSDVFEDRVRAARVEADPARAATQLDAALALWRGPAYAEFADEEFARAEAARLNSLRHLAREDHVGMLLAMDANEDAIDRLRSIVADEPLRERPREQLMLALYRTGRMAEALSSYREYRALLDHELGVEPGRKLVDLERRILRRDTSLMLTDERPVTSVALPAQPLAPGRPVAARAFSSSFIGREADLAATDRLLAARQVLTLVGVGGVGKTELARQLITRIADRFPDGVATCELGAISHPAQVAAVIASALGLIPEPGQELTEQVIEALSRRHSLVFLDNCEHVLQAVAEFVDRILSSNAGTQILATSREPLGARDEQIWHVSPLPVPVGDDLRAASVQLFVTRAEAVDPAFVPTLAVAELCRRLDGIPLAIELAAARISSMTVLDILDRLDEQSEVLRSPRRSTPSRHRSLRSVVDWSYRLLDPIQMSVFDQLAVFPDDFCLDAATEVVHGPSKAEIATVVLDLVDRSLVKHTATDGRSRYVLLDTLRRYARSHLREQDQLAELRDRHASWCLRLAERLGLGCGAGNSDWIRSLDRELPNLRAAQQWLLSQNDVTALLSLMESLHYYAIWSLNPEVFDWARDTIALPEAGEDPLIAAAYATAADGAWLAGDMEDSRLLAERGVSIAGLADHPAGLYALISLGNALASFAGRFTVRVDLYQRAAELATKAGREPQRIIAELYRGACLLHLGQEPDGRLILDQTARDAGRLQSPDLLAKAELIRADLLLRSEPARALSAYWRTVDLNARSGNRYQEYQTIISAAFAELMYGDRRTAAATFRSLLTRWTTLLRNAPLFCVLQGVVILLVDAHRHLEAAILVGAIPPDTVTIAFTVDEQVIEQLATATRTAERKLGASLFAEATERGRGLDREATFKFAVAALDLTTDQQADSGEASALT